MEDKERIKALKEDGVIEFLYVKKFITKKMFRYMEYCEKVVSFQNKGQSKSAAVRSTADYFDVSDRVIWKAIEVVY